MEAQDEPVSLRPDAHNCAGGKQDYDTQPAENRQAEQQCRWTRAFEQWDHSDDEENNGRQGRQLMDIEQQSFIGLAGQADPQAESECDKQQNGGKDEMGGHVKEFLYPEKMGQCISIYDTTTKMDTYVENMGEDTLPSRNT